MGFLGFTGNNPLFGSGIFSAYPTGGSIEVVLPVNLSPQSLATDSLELLIEGSATASFGAIRGTGGECASGDITVQFCAEDPAAITIDNGTSLASLGVRYALWPTVNPAPGCADVPL